MSLIRFDDLEPNRAGRTKPLSLIVGIGAIVGAITLGSTFAANINLNGGGNVEFGQGVLTTSACDEDGITVTPFSTFVNETGAGSHKLSSIRISGIDSSEGACEGKTFRIRAYGATGPALDLFEWEERDFNEDTFEYGPWTVTDGPFDYVDITRTASDFLWTSDGTDDDDVIDIDQSNIEQTAFTLNLVSGEPTIRRTPLALANDVKKITVETFAATETVVTYDLGDIGPGGGIVYYYNETGFACGPILSSTCNYLEYAPNRNWNGEENEFDPNYQWAETNYQLIEIGSGAQNASIGSGYANSVAITTQGNGISTAAGASREYRGGGKSDWYLPSREELNQLCVFVHDLGVDVNGICITDGTVIDSNPQSANAAAKGFQIVDYYWNSTEGSSNGVQGQWFFDGSFYNPAQKQYGFKVRPIRAF
jgi:hypothetical protein